MLSLRVGTAQPFRAGARAPARAIVTRPVAPTSSMVLGGLRVGERDDGETSTTQICVGDVGEHVGGAISPSRPGCAPSHAWGTALSNPIMGRNAASALPRLPRPELAHPDHPIIRCRRCSVRAVGQRRRRDEVDDDAPRQPRQAPRQTGRPAQGSHPRPRHPGHPARPNQDHQGKRKVQPPRRWRSFARELRPPAVGSVARRGAAAPLQPFILGHSRPHTHCK
eukprot:39607-Chlamydomonas_euryale.AAC.8